MKLLQLWKQSKKHVMTSLIQMFRKWQHLHLGTEPKTVVPSLIQLLGKRRHRHMGNGHRDQD